MKEKLWQPGEALERIEQAGVGKHFALVRKPHAETLRSAMWRGAVAALQNGNPLPPPPLVNTVWVGDLRNFPDMCGPSHATAYVLEATRICDHGFTVEDMFEEDGRKIDKDLKTGIFPLLIVTEISYTRRWLPGQDEHIEIDPNFFDKEGPDKIQNLCLNMGVAVFRTTCKELREKINGVMVDLHLGRKNSNLIIP